MEPLTVKDKCTNSHVAVFLGAGANEFLNIPLINNLTETLDITIVENLSKLIKIEDEERHNIELMLARIDMVENAMGDVLKYLHSDNSDGVIQTLKQTLTKIEHERIEINRYIYDKIWEASDAVNQKRSFGFHGKLLNELIKYNDNNIVPIITTNYDTVIEDMCEQNNIKYTDGWHKPGRTKNFKWLGHDQIEYDDHKIAYYKLHGSINWFIDRKNRDYKYLEYKADVTKIDKNYGPIFVPPRMNKDKEIHAHKLLLDTINNCQDIVQKIDTIIVIGFKFGDGFINNNIVSKMLREEVKIVVVNIDPDSAIVNIRKLENHIKANIISIKCKYGYDTNVIGLIMEKL